MEQDSDNEINNNLAEKIINQLRLILTASTSIEDFSIIPSTTSSFDRNVSPVHHIETEQCLGLESWCVKHLFRYSQKQILNLQHPVLKRPAPEDIEKLNMYCNVALLIQPEVNTFWNIKRQLYSHLVQDQEMHFTTLVLSYKPKSLQAYTYRVWLINKQQHSDHPTILQKELKINKKAVSALTNNYHGWNHRIWCMENLFSKINDTNILINEFLYSQEFIFQHVSEHSGFHYRQYIIKQFRNKNVLATQKLLSDFQFVDYNLVEHEKHPAKLIFSDTETLEKCNLYLNLLLHELLQVCKELNLFYAGHEAIWYHRRFVLYEIISFLHNIYGIKRITRQSFENETFATIFCTNKFIEQVVPNNDGRCMVHDTKLFKNLVVYEEKFLRLLCKPNNVTHFCDNLYIERHEGWLRCFLNFDLDDKNLLKNEEILFSI